MKRRVKTIYYYAISIENSKLALNETHNAYTIISEIFKKNAKSNSMNLAQGEKFVTMDIIKNDSQFLFAKVGEIKPSAEMQLRNYRTLERKEVISPEDKKELGVEICTHFLLDYETGIVGFVFGKAAPSVNILVNMVNTYSDEYVMSISNIVSGDSVQALLKPGSQIRKISYKALVPDIRILEHINLPRELAYNLLSNEELEVEVTIKERGRTPLFTGRDKISEAIHALKGKINNKSIENVKVNGKTTNSLSQDYKFIEQKLNSKVDITYEVDDFNQIIEESEKVDEQFYSKMMEEYQVNRGTLILLANRDRE